jgi:hypothetical protein
MLDFLESLRKGAVAEPAKPRAAAAPAPAKAGPAPAATVKLEEPPPPAPKIKKKPQPQPKAKAAPKAVPKGRALVPIRRTPRPRPVRGSARRLAPVVFKLLVGVGVASAAVAMQDRLPNF